MPDDEFHIALLKRLAEEYSSLDAGGRALYRELLRPGVKIRVHSIKTDDSGKSEIEFRVLDSKEKKTEQKGRSKNRPAKTDGEVENPKKKKRPSRVWVHFVQGGAPGLGKRA